IPWPVSSRKRCSVSGPIQTKRTADAFMSGSARDGSACVFQSTSKKDQTLALPTRSAARRFTGCAVSRERIAAASALVTRQVVSGTSRYGVIGAGSPASERAEGEVREGRLAGDLEEAHEREEGGLRRRVVGVVGAALPLVVAQELDVLLRALRPELVVESLGPLDHPL